MRRREEKPVGIESFLLWRRFLARLLDFLIWLLAAYRLGSFLVPDPARQNLAWFYAVQTLAAVFMILTEPLLLALTGRTPGKLLLRLRVAAPDGGRLTLARACSRSWQVWREGLGFGLPLYRLLALTRSYAAARQGEVAGWEEGTSMSW